ncbi:hypothetical protein AVEN_127965-1 [Araneus ventricosus]|uniref:Uncharacterized protein n=1 Tax=Araneus ventricosus TaxID=182803 RepID=A0A4Y1ZZ29_ARAVE|nr:hypothetical protein AVEN_127965-1 [Araneus ventricosus]
MIKSSLVTDRSSIKQSSASIENYQISSDSTTNGNVNLSQNIVTNLSSSGHMFVNAPIPGTSTSETTVSSEIVQPYSKALPRIIKRFRKRAKSAILTSTPEKQKIEELLKRA